VLTWTQSSTPGVTGNCIYRGTVSGTYSLPGTCIKPGTTYTDSTPVAGTTYYYAVTAQVGGAESAYSIPAQVVVPANPNAPTGLTAPTVTKNYEPCYIEHNGWRVLMNCATDLQATVLWKVRP